MRVTHPSNPAWLVQWMVAHAIELWGAADLTDFATPRDAGGQRLPYAVTWAIPMNPHIMAGIQQGPNQAYADEYARVNDLITEQAKLLTQQIQHQDFNAYALAVSARTDTINIQGDFPHKTAATRAGMGWIGRHCQLITRRFGSWIRLGTVFTDMVLTLGSPLERSYCGRCMRCVEACPAKALKGSAWFAGLARDAILDAAACDRWKKENYIQYHQGHNCGICSAVCPYGQKALNLKILSGSQMNS